MSKLVGTLVLLVFGVAAVALAAPALTGLLNSLEPLIAVLTVAAVMLRLVWWYTRHW